MTLRLTALYHYAEFRYAESHVKFIVMLYVIMMNVNYAEYQLC
jgi:hypothetical protein